MADEKISTGGGPAIDGNVDTRGDFVGRDTARSNNTINFQASPDALNQFYLILVQIQLDLSRLDDRFERQSTQIQDMKIDINALKIDMVSVKQEMRTVQHGMEIRRTQSETHSQELQNLKIQVAGIAQTASAVNEIVQGVTENMTFRNKMETVILIIGLGALGVWIILQQVIQ